MTKEEFDVETKLDNLLKTNTSDRKLRLFAVACCREIQYLMKDERSIKAVDVAELFADELATQQELDAARAAANEAVSDATRDARAAWDAASVAAWDAWDAAWDAWAAARAAAWDATFAAARDAAWYTARDAKAAANNQQIKLFKDIVNPYANSINPNIVSWNNNIIPQMAQTFYDTKNFNDMLILADALEESGCIDLDILSHCRNNEVHVKGCWVVDLILGKS